MGRACRWATRTTSPRPIAATVTASPRARSSSRCSPSSSAAKAAIARDAAARCTSPTRPRAILAQTASSAAGCRLRSARRSAPRSGEPARWLWRSSATGPTTRGPFTRRSTSPRSGSCRSSSSARTINMRCRCRWVGRPLSPMSPIALRLTRFPELWSTATISPPLLRLRSRRPNGRGQARVRH